MLPEGVGQLRVRGVHYQGFLVDLTFDGTTVLMNASLSSPASSSLPPPLSLPSSSFLSSSSSLLTANNATTLCVGWPYAPQDDAAAPPAQVQCLTTQAASLEGVQYPAKLFVRRG